MKQTLFLALFVLCFALPALAQQNVYQCIRPDGTVICTVQDTSGNPSVTCNHDCQDCNMVCAAKLRLTSQDGGPMEPVAPPAVTGVQRPRTTPGTVETPAFCAQRYQQCVAQCKSSPANRDPQAMDACLSSCQNWKSGCGKWNPARDGSK